VRHIPTGPMAPKMTASTGKGGSSAKGPLKTSKISTSQPRASIANRFSEAKWHVADYKPQRKITDEELNAARQIFFSLDTDASGSIDEQELGVMLRQLGQNPTDEEMKELIDSVDDGDKYGKIQLREFLKLYTSGLDNKHKGSREDVDDVFRAVNEAVTGDTHGQPGPRLESISKEGLSQLLVNDFELQIEPTAIEEIVSCSKGADVLRDEMASFLAAPIKP